MYNLRSRAKAVGSNEEDEEETNGDMSAAGDKVKKEAAGGRASLIMFGALLIDLLAFTLILPLFPALLDHYKRHDDGLYPYLEASVEHFGSALGAPANFNSVLFGGCLGSLFSFLQFVSSPLVGGLSDHYGRRPLLLLTAAGVSLSYFMWVRAASFAAFVAARVVGGLAKGNVSLAAAVVTDVSTPKTRGRGMALIGIAFSIGFLVGPMVGAIFAAWAKDRQQEDWFVYPAGVALSLSLLDLLFLYVCFKETLPEHQRLQSLSAALRQAAVYVNPVSLFKFASLKKLQESEKRSLRTLGLVYFIYLFLYSGLEFTLTFLTHLRFGFTSVDQGKMFLFVGALMAAVQGGYTRRIPAGKEKSVALWGLIIIVPSFAVVGFAYNLVTLYVGLTLYALSTAVCVPCMTTMVSAYGDASQKGIVTGVFRSLGALGRALGPMAASALYWMTGPELCYCLGGLGLLIPYVMLKNS